MPFDHRGTRISTTEAEREQDDYDQRPASQPMTQDMLKQRRETEVRAFYERLTAPPWKQTGNTSFDVGQGMKDYIAFERCAEEFGFKRAVVALAKVSVKAGERYASYKRAWRLP